MVVSATHFNEVTNGYQRETSGLWVHRGNVMAPNSYFDVGTLRARASAVPAGGWVGEGLEILYQNDHSYIQSLDRDAAPPGGVLRPLTINATPINMPNGSVLGSVLADGAITSAKIADGTIATTDIAANAVQQLMGSYIGSPSFSTPGTNVWYETPIQVNVVLTGLAAYVRVEASCTLNNSVASAVTYVGLGWDGSAQFTMAAMNQSNNSYVWPAGFTWYGLGPNFGSGARRFAVFLQCNAGVSTIWSSTHCAMYVTEQKR